MFVDGSQCIQYTEVLLSALGFLETIDAKMGDRWIDKKTGSYSR